MTSEQAEALISLAIWIELECSEDVPVCGREVARIAGVEQDQDWLEIVRRENEKRRAESEQIHQQWLERKKAERAKIQEEYEARPETIEEHAAVAAMSDAERYEHNKAVLAMLRSHVRDTRLKKVDNAGE